MREYRFTFQKLKHYIPITLSSSHEYCYTCQHRLKILGTQQISANKANLNGCTKSHTIGNFDIATYITVLITSCSCVNRLLYI